MDHINRQKTDNCKENLRWASNSEQRDNCNTKPVNVYKDDKLFGYYKSFALATKNTNVSKRQIGRCIANKTKTRGGYTFELADKE